MRLKSRAKGIPHGLRFHIPEINWSSVSAVGKHPSWEVLVHAIISARNANPNYRDKHKWSTDVETVANEVDAYNTKICLDNGWNTFLEGGDGRSPPKSSLPNSLTNRAGNVAAGANVLVHWLSSGAESVSGEQSNRRAGVCVACPLNQSGDMTSFFTVPVARAIRAALNTREGWNLKTGYDDRLGVCSACSCPLKLKVHLPIDQISPLLSPEQAGALHPSCWIKSEWPSVS